MVKGGKRIAQPNSLPGGNNAKNAKSWTTLPVLTLPQYQRIKPVKINMFPDSGASVCLAGPQHITKLALQQSDLIPYSKQVSAVSRSKLLCMGWSPINFQIGNKTTPQLLYICSKVDRIYFSKQGCIDVNILYHDYPNVISPSVAQKSTNSSVAHIKDSSITQPSVIASDKVPLSATLGYIPHKYTRMARHYSIPTNKWKRSKAQTISTWNIQWHCFQPKYPIPRNEHNTSSHPP